MNLQPDGTPQAARPPRLTAAVLWWFIGGAAVLVALIGIGVMVALRAPLWGVRSSTLHIAAIHWPQDIVPLIRAGHNVNSLEGGETPLSRAVTFRKVESVRLLLAHGADPDLCGPGADPPLASPFLHYTEPDSLQIVGLLLDAGADPNVHGTFEQTPLHQAADTGNLALVRTLLAAGADVNARSDIGPPLQRAVEKNNAVIVEELLQAGAVPGKYSGASPAIRELIDRYGQPAGVRQP